MGRAPALTLAGARFDEAVLVQYSDTGLTGRTLCAVSSAVEVAWFRSAPKLSHTK